MGIRSISRTARPGLGFAPPWQGGSAARRPVTEDPAVLSSLTWGDREIIAVMFGADILSTGRDADGTLVGVPPFVWLVAEDRRSGRLSVGSEITSSYLQAIWDAQVTPLGGPLSGLLTGPLSGPLSEQSLAAALVFLGRRTQGATVDIRA